MSTRELRSRRISPIGSSPRESWGVEILAHRFGSGMKILENQARDQHSGCRGLRGLLRICCFINGLKKSSQYPAAPSGFFFNLGLVL